MTYVAVLAICTIISKCLDNPLISRLLKNAAKHSTNQIDDFVIKVIYDLADELPEATTEQVKEKLDETQKKYDNLTPEEREKMKQEPGKIPVNGPPWAPAGNQG